MQESGEHSECSPNPLDSESGFAYDPMTLTVNGLRYYSFPWSQQDNFHLIKYMSDVVKVAATHIKNNEGVLIHCHAGRGRSAVIASCLMIFLRIASGQEALDIVRKKRQNSLREKRLYEQVYSYENSGFLKRNQNKPYLFHF